MSAGLSKRSASSAASDPPVELELVLHDELVHFGELGDEGATGNVGSNSPGLTPRTSALTRLTYPGLRA
jgi:hypothetical protein